MNNQDSIYLRLTEHAKTMTDLMLAAYDAGIHTFLSVEIKEGIVKSFTKEEVLPADTSEKRLHEELFNGTIIECLQHGKRFAWKRKSNINL